MAAVLIPARATPLPHLLRLPPITAAAGAIEEVRYALGDRVSPGPLWLDAGDWGLTLPVLAELQALLASRGLELERVCCLRPDTLVAAAALGLETAAAPDRTGSADGPATTTGADDLTLHRGTLRSGDHLQSEGTVLLLGDLNPGARISAVGDVLVWGRLRGVAHAGCRGHGQARIVALELRPLQLRIADAVARGPDDRPPPGLAEEARLVDGVIRIDPARPSWPLSPMPLSD
jgi:septum site-determining protein MinC